jgi:DNA (cytosine-5)-methyltransferase 1
LELSVHGEIAALAKTKKVKQKTIHAVDLFCGAGGTSTGLIDAVNGLGYAIKLTAINHWDVAIATHSKNHEDVEHYCQSIETVNPTDVIKGGRLQLLVASPECTHHSRARGGKPVSDQKRADAWLLMRWIEKLYVENILIENVKEFVEWGPLTAKNKPDKRYKGHYFRHFIETLKINYNVEYRFLNCADYGDPTTRERFFLLARRGNKKIVWPKRTHASRKELAKMARQPDLFGDDQKLEPWVPARNVIDWSLEGKSIFGRKKPLKENTLRRIYAGLMKYSLKPFIVPQHSSNGPRDIERPVPTVTTTSRGVGLCEPFVIGQQSGASPRDVGEPMPTVAGKGAVALVEPFLVNLKGTNRRDRDIDEPTFTQAAHGNHQGVVEVEPFLIKNFSGSDKSRSKSVEEPLGTVAANFNHHYLVEPFIVSAAHGGNTNPPRDIEEPLGSVLGSPKFGVCEPFIVPFFGEREGQEPRTRDIQEPTPTVTTNNRMGLCEPFLVRLKNNQDVGSVDDPLKTLTTKESYALAEPYLVKFYGNEKGAESINEPLDTVTGKDRFGLCIPSIGAVLDIRFRMLQPHELAAAMSFPKEYEFTGNREAKVKQIGNAVPLKTAAALCRALLS